LHGVPPVFLNNSHIVSFSRNKQKIYTVKIAPQIESFANGFLGEFNYFCISLVDNTVFLQLVTKQNHLAMN